MSDIDPSNPLFIQAASFVQYTNQHVFLTGKAGTGKTTFLNYIREHSFKKLAVVAPTGVAAINAKGTTIHSFFQLPFGTFLPSNSGGWGQYNENVISIDRLLSTLRLRQPQRILMQSLDLLIIDEVSMLRADVLDAIDRILRMVRKKPAIPFGGVQMLFIGDLHQLPPVVRNEEWPLLASHYASPFFFQAKVLAETSIFYIELQKIYRQTDTAFIEILEHVRNNCCSEEDMQQLHERFDPAFKPSVTSGYITLTTHNYKAERINKTALERLAGRTFRLIARIEREFPANAYPADEILELKEGAQVMFIKNDKGENRRYYNGKIGIVKNVSMKEGVVTVHCTDSGTLIELEREVWRNIRYRYNSDKDEIEEEELGTFYQYPLRLAWAVTIHKSQGLTFEKAIIDAEQSFAAGQVYVALSRLTSLQGLILRSKISGKNIIVDPRIRHFANNKLSEATLAAQLPTYQQEFAQKLLLATYEYDTLLSAFRQHVGSYSRKAIPDKADAFERIKHIFTQLVRHAETAAKFTNKLQRHLEEKASDYGFIHERNTAAAHWFNDDLAASVLAPLKDEINAQEGKSRTRKHIRELEGLERLVSQKMSQMDNSLMITRALAERQDIVTAFQNWQIATKSKKKTHPDNREKTSGKSRQKGDTQKISLQLFQQGKTIEEIATIRQLVPGTITNHLIGFIHEGRVKVETFVQPDRLLIIAELLREKPKASASEIKNQLGADYSYTEIRAVRAYLGLDKVG